MKNPRSKSVTIGNITVKYHPVTKSGREYWLVTDFSTGQRRSLNCKNEEAARIRALEVAENIQRGKQDLLNLDRRELALLLHARDLLHGAKLATTVVIDAVKHYLASGITVVCHKPMTEAVSEFLKNHRASPARLISLGCFLKGFADHFQASKVHEVDQAAVERWMNAKEWGKNSRNDARQAVSQFYKAAAVQKWVPKDYNPAKGIAHLKLSRSTVQIFEPDQLRVLFAALEAKAPELCPALAMWAFAGIRLEEIGRLTWEQVNRGLAVGLIEMQGNQTKTGEPRNAAIDLKYQVDSKECKTSNLRAWLEKYRRTEGTVLPDRWLKGTKLRSNRLGEIPRVIQRQTGLSWKHNGPRHSFGTFAFKLTRDPGYVVRIMGTSLEKFQKNYWNKSEVVTEAAAVDYFAIMPAPVAVAIAA